MIKLPTTPIERLAFLSDHTDTGVVRLILAFGAILWSVMLFWPGETFGRPTYILMGRFATEEMWATMYGIQGCYALYAVLWNVSTKFSLILEGALGCALWTGATICMVLSVYPPPAAIAGEIILAFASWWVLVRFPQIQQ